MADMIKLKPEEPEERILICAARRGPKGKVICEKPALHAWGIIHWPHHDLVHAGRGRSGRWHFWL